MDEYTEKAKQFLKQNNIRMRIKYHGHGCHFIGETEQRDIYRVVIRNSDGRQMTVMFGQSIARSDYGGTPPTPYDILSCLIKNDPGDLEMFCHEFGYDSDSRKAERIWKLCCKEWAGVNRVFGNCLDELLEIN